VEKAIKEMRGRRPQEMMNLEMYSNCWEKMV
jgi:hypothetical protein